MDGNANKVDPWCRGSRGLCRPDCLKGKRLSDELYRQTRRLGPASWRGDETHRSPPGAWQFERGRNLDVHVVVGQREIRIAAPQRLEPGVDVHLDAVSGCAG